MPEHNTPASVSVGDLAQRKDWLIWSYEHNAWWGPNRCGYYTELRGAGLYTEAEAKQIEADANRGCKHPNEQARHVSMETDAIRHALERCGVLAAALASPPRCSSGRSIDRALPDVSCTREEGHVGPHCNGDAAWVDVEALASPPPSERGCQCQCHDSLGLDPCRLCACSLRPRAALAAGSASTNPAEEPTRRWAVSVDRNGDTILTIASEHLSGRDLSPEDEDTIRHAATHLLSFIGEPAGSASTKGQEDEKE